jgi:hypothetical protein
MAMWVPGGRSGRAPRARPTLNGASVRRVHAGWRGAGENDGSISQVAQGGGGPDHGVSAVGNQDVTLWRVEDMPADPFAVELERVAEAGFAITNQPRRYRPKSDRLARLLR